MKKTVFITGASSGLGNATAIYFAEKGWDVIATMRNISDGNNLLAHENIQLLPLDVTSPESVKRAFDDATANQQKIDVVVNNAGVGIYGPLEFISDTDIDRQYAVNVRGVIDVIRIFIPHFKENKGGAFINVSSLMGLSTALPLGSLYNMSKFALEGLIEGLYFELKPLNIRLHLVEPGGFISKFAANTTLQTNDHIRDYDILLRNVRKAMDFGHKPGALPEAAELAAIVFELADGKRTAFRTTFGVQAKAILTLRKLLPIKVFLNLIAKQFSKDK